ncbi:hypothetical protein [Pseudobacteriovorax antillogorgiicola]|uniref:Lipoprotein n=1 Tax=Pseudobacteriovorax antillogorgiicola TaxID=1513793 RepID=A0A1Y6C5J5_9BACT|nr:hypothetical protein [Pseudobacteriovorax antillogorgiicola]TCS51138.1 hypothetical protein EDD56_11119 [Pseudobacteriovorax antillogorgiicola]SMF38397.1 hypothetical protein SAMN06296036_111158 [Pseudobacteriovorax antillogorgiicola]
MKSLLTVTGISLVLGACGKSGGESSDLATITLPAFPADYDKIELLMNDSTIATLSSGSSEAIVVPVGTHKFDVNLYLQDSLIASSKYTPCNGLSKEILAGPNSLDLKACAENGGIIEPSDLDDGNINNLDVSIIDAGKFIFKAGDTLTCEPNLNWYFRDVYIDSELRVTFDITIDSRESITLYGDQLEGQVFYLVGDIYENFEFHYDSGALKGLAFDHSDAVTKELRNCSIAR